MKIDSLIAEITSGGMARFDETGQIDYISLRRWIKSELKRFGSNIMVMSDKVIHIDNHKGKLPDNFWQLILAVNCEPQGYVCNGNKNVLQNSLFFKERLEGIQEWDNASESYIGKDFKFVREEIYFKDTASTVYYGNFRPLALRKGFDRRVCAPGCKNLTNKFTDNDVNNINIVGDYINTNFEKGSIYLQYKGLVTDEEGDLIIPETQHDRLKEYLISYCRYRILEDIGLGKDDDVIQWLKYYKDKADVDFGLAMTEVKMEALGPNWVTTLRNKQRLQTLKYEFLPTR